MNTPEELEALANRIDHEELWRVAGSDQHKLTPEQKDRLWAGISLRRYADQRGEVLEKLKEGAEYMRGARLNRVDFSTDRRGCGDLEWHRAINAESERMRAEDPEAWPGVMYLAKMISDEVPRMILLFEADRTVGMPDSFRMSAHDPRPPTPLPNNKLRCALGVNCRECPMLTAIDRSDRMTPEAKDEAKAWTCATHFLIESQPGVYCEQILADQSDAAFDCRLAESFGAEF